MRIGRNGIGALSAIVLVGALMPGVVSAAPKTRWVDDDGKAGATSCDGTLKASKTIQGAITASGLGDTVQVCPGVYAEELSITGDQRSLITIRSVVPGKAIIRSLTTGGIGVLVKIGSDDVTFAGFKLQARTAAPCVAVSRMVEVNGPGAVLTGNTMVPLGTATMGLCGYAYGVFVNSPGTARLDSNTIVDFQQTGITAFLTEARVRSYRDKVRYLHATVLPSDGVILSTRGIAAMQGATVRVVGSVIESRAAPTAGDYRLTSGIFMQGVTGGRVVNTTVTRGDTGINLQGASNVTISGVTVTGSKQGLDLDQGSLNSILSSTIHGTQGSIRLGATTQANQVKDTDADGTGTFDCVDQSSAAGGGVDNEWTNVTGTGSPPEICNP